MRILSGILLALLSLSGWTKEEALYPSNPNLFENAIFVAGSGVTRLEVDGLIPTWHNLDGIEPFEPVVAKGLVLVGSPSGLYALDVETGDLKWHLLSPRALFTPTVVGDTAYAGSEDGNLRAIDLQSGRERWSHRLTGWVFSPAVVGGHLVTGGSEGKVWGLTANDGSERWQKEVGEELIFHPVAGSDDPVYISTTNGEVLAIDSRKGELRWQARLESPTTATVFGSRIFFVQFNGMVAAHDRYDGKKLWEYQLNSSSTIPARILDGKVLAISDDGASVMLDPESGEVIGEVSAPLPEQPPVEPETPQELKPTADQLMASWRK